MFVIGRERHVMITHYIAAIRRGYRGERLVYPGDEQATIMNALEMLLAPY